MSKSGGRAGEKSVGEPADAFADLVDATRRPAAQPEFGGGTLERKSISEQVASRIMSMIKSGNLRPRRPAADRGADGHRLGISRPPLREALKALTLMGVLESRQGGRYTVTDLSPSRLVAPFNVMLSIRRVLDVHEHFEARAVVDLELVRLGTLRATDEQRRRIMQHAIDGRAFYNDPVAFRLLDIEFHQSLNDAADNRLLSALAQGLYDIGLDVRRIASAIPGNIEKSVAQHMDVAEAVAAADAQRAVGAYRKHLDASRHHHRRHEAAQMA